MAAYPFAENDEEICHCMHVSAFEIMKAVYDGKLDSIDEVSAKTHASLGCGGCRQRVEELIDETWGYIKASETK